MHCDLVGAQMMLHPGALAEMYWKDPETALLIWLEHGALMIALQNSSSGCYVLVDVMCISGQRRKALLSICTEI